MQLINHLVSASRNATTKEIKLVRNIFWENWYNSSLLSAIKKPKVAECREVETIWWCVLPYDPEVSEKIGKIKHRAQICTLLRTSSPSNIWDSNWNKSRVIYCSAHDIVCHIPYILMSVRLGKLAGWPRGMHTCLEAVSSALESRPRYKLSSCCFTNRVIFQCVCCPFDGC